MIDYPSYTRLDLRDWLDTFERKPDAPEGESQISGSEADEKPRPARVRNRRLHRT